MEKAPADETIEDTAGKWLKEEPTAGQVAFGDFTKIDLHITKIVNTKRVNEQTSRSGSPWISVVKLATYWQLSRRPTDQESWQVNTIMVPNLKRRKMKLAMSEVKVLAVGPGDTSLWSLKPHDGAELRIRMMQISQGNIIMGGITSHNF